MSYLMRLFKYRKTSKNIDESLKPKKLFLSKKLKLLLIHK